MSCCVMLHPEVLEEIPHVKMWLTLIGRGLAVGGRSLGDELLFMQVGEELTHGSLGHLLGRVAPVDDRGVTKSGRVD